MRIFIRPITINDGQYIVKWRNNEVVQSHCFSKAQVTLASNEKFFKDNVLSGKYKQFMVERVEEDYGLATYPIATIYLKDIDYKNKRCELCVFSNNDKEWIPESQSSGIRMLIDKAFREYGMHKVYSYVFKKFPDEIDILVKAGFNEEAILEKEAMNKEGGYEDVVRLCIINE